MKADILYAFRSLLKTPIFAIVAIASLALGIGANTAVFSLLDKIMLEMLPVERPQELVLLNQVGPRSGRTESAGSFSYPMYRELRDRASDSRAPDGRRSVFSGLVAHNTTDLSLADGDVTERVAGDIVTGNYFDVLGIRPALGRLFTPEDERTPDGHPVIVLSYGYWQQRFGGDPKVLDRKVLVNGYPMTIIGVAEKGFNTLEVGRVVDVMAPVMMKNLLTPTFGHLLDRRYWWLEVFGRLKPGVSREQARAQLQSVYMASLEQDLAEMPDWNNKDRWMKKTVQLLDGHKGTSGLRQSLSGPLQALMVMVALVLLIACANLANLLLARGASRRREIAIRLSLGAGRSQIIRQLLTESVVLAILGGVAGLILAWWTVDVLTAMLQDGSATRQPFQLIDGRVLAFNFLLSVLTGVVFGLAPALQSTRQDVVTALKDEAGSVSAAGGHVRMRKTLVTAQVALSLLLLVGAGLFARTLANLKNLNPGFRTDNLVQFSVDASLNGYSPERAAQLYSRLQDALTGRPGVSGVSLSDNGVLSGSSNRSTISIPGFQRPEGLDMNPTKVCVSPGFFSGIGLPLHSGRDFTALDTMAGPPVAIVNERFARTYFPNLDNVLGQTFSRQSGKTRQTVTYQIVGVVADSKFGNLREETRRIFYVPHTQHDELGHATFYVRGSGDASQIVTLIRNEVRQLDPNLPVTGIQMMEETINQSLAPERLAALLSVAFGGLATLLAAIGLYGVMAYTVARRTREIGIRMALGAERGSVLWLVMKEVALMVAIGLGIGIPAAVVTSKYVEAQLYGVRGGDLAVLAAATVLLCVVAAMAGYVPARRAVSIEPVRALRYE